MLYFFRDCQTLTPKCWDVQTNYDRRFTAEITKRAELFMNYLDLRLDWFLNEKKTQTKWQSCWFPSTVDFLCLQFAAPFSRGGPLVTG